MNANSLQSLVGSPFSSAAFIPTKERVKVKSKGPRNYFEENTTLPRPVITSLASSHMFGEPPGCQG